MEAFGIDVMRVRNGTYDKELVVIELNIEDVYFLRHTSDKLCYIHFDKEFKQEDSSFLDADKQDRVIASLREYKKELKKEKKLIDEMLKSLNGKANSNKSAEDSQN